jgi:hypothetical protein
MSDYVPEVFLSTSSNQESTPIQHADYDDELTFVGINQFQSPIQVSENESVHGYDDEPGSIIELSLGKQIVTPIQVSENESVHVAMLFVQPYIKPVNDDTSWSTCTLLQPSISPPHKRPPPHMQEEKEPIAASFVFLRATPDVARELTCRRVSGDFEAKATLCCENSDNDTSLNRTPEDQEPEAALSEVSGKLSPSLTLSFPPNSQSPFPPLNNVLKSSIRTPTPS